MKIPILDENDLNALILEALNGNGVLATPKEMTDMLKNIPGISISQKMRKDGRFQGYVVDDDEKTYVYGKTREEVATKIRFYLKNGMPKKKKQDKKIKNGIPQTFDAFAQYYFENFRKKTVASQTIKADLNRYNNYIKPRFNEMFIKKITPKDCQALLDEIAADGKGKTVDEVHSLLNIIFKMAIRHDVIEKNPLDIVFHVSHERKHGKALTKEEENAFIKAINGSHWRVAYALALYTGLRPNELKTAKIDGEFVIAINSKRKTKKAEYKKIPVSAKLAPFLGDVTVPPLDKLRSEFKSYLPNHILYDLRTTFYSRCKECGISDYAISEYMGHSLGALGNAYTDLSDDFLLSEMQKFKY